MNTTHAILYGTERTDRTILMYNGGGIFVEWPKDEYINLVDLCEHCACRDGITHLWIHGTAHMRVVYDERQLEDDMKKMGYDCLYHWDEDNLVSMHGYKKYEKGRSQRFNIIFLEYSSWDWSELSPVEVFKLIENLQDALGVPVGASPSGVGYKFLQETTAKHKGWLAKPEVDLSTIPWEEAARPLIWQRQPTREELNCEFLYAVDKNSAHGRSAYEESFGIGEVIYVKDATFNHLLPGIWRCDVIPVSHPEYDWYHLPLPVWDTQDVWLATPLIKLLQKMGYDVHIHEAWIFPKYAKVYRAWIENLWQWRKDSMGPEKDAYKSIIVDTLGLTRSALLGPDSYKYRPDHYSQIVGGTRAVMMYNIVKYAGLGIYPVMCQIDALYYCSSNPLPNAAIPGILDHQESLGGYKLKFKLPMDATMRVDTGIMTVRALLMSSMPQSKKLKYLNILAHHMGY